MFIIVDGIDGSGKTTTIQAIQQELKLAIQDPDYEVSVFSEVNDSRFKKELVHILGSEAMTNITRLKAIELARAEFIPLITHKLARGGSVIMDRYLPSTIAYQLLVGDIMETRAIHQIKARFLEDLPTGTISVDVSQMVLNLFKPYHAIILNYLETQYSQYGTLSEMLWVPSVMVRMTTPFMTCLNRLERESSNGLFESDAFEVYLRYSAYEYVFTILAFFYSQIATAPSIIEIDGSVPIDEGSIGIVSYYDILSPVMKRPNSNRG